MTNPSLARVRQFSRDAAGASMVEFSLIAFLVFVLVGGMVDFGIGFYQWNSASKAMQQGVRLAAVSDPVDSSLKSMTGTEAGVIAGDPFPAFTSVCNGATQSCSCTGATHACIYSAAAMSTVVYGRGQDSCGSVGPDKTPAMCDVFTRIAPQNVKITYAQTGLGFAGRPGGPVPTITVELQNVTFNFVFLNSVLGFVPITMPAMKTTATGEDMSTTN